MQTIELTATVSADHTLSAHVPDSIPTGEYRVTMNVTPAKKNIPQTPEYRLSDSLLFLPIGPLEPNQTYRREEIYDDDGR